MAKFTPNSNLTFKDDKSKKFVEFIAEAEIEFEEQDLKKEWEFRVDYSDKENDNALIKSFARSLTPKKSIHKVKINEKVKRVELKVDMSNIEVAINVKIFFKERGL